MQYSFEINGPIGYYEGSSYYVKENLSKYKNKPVHVRINSLGGSVDHALNIATMFQEHGDVTIDMVGLNASSATIIAMGAKKVRIHENGLYLIHKPMQATFFWDYANEDDLQNIIDKLSKEKKSLEAITVIMVALYNKKCQKEHKKIVDLMKEDRWITASEAREWGFVDEIYSLKDGKIDEITNNAKQFIASMGLPDPGKTNSSSPSFVDKITGFFNNKIQPPIMNKKFVAVMALLSITDGIKENEDKTISLSLDQLQAIETALADSKTKETTLNETISQKIKEMQNLTEQVTALKKKPAKETSQSVAVVDDEPKEINSQMQDELKIVKSATELFNLINK